jgi:uncharacterized protein (DUF2267 family)
MRKLLASLMLAIVFTGSLTFGKQTPVAAPAVPVQGVPIGPGGAVTTIILPDGTSAVVPAGLEDGPPVPGGPAGKEGEKAKPKESPRLKKFQQLQHDRRPSAILKAWAEPLPRLADDLELDGPLNPPEADAIDAELAYFRRAVTLGDWNRVREYFQGLEEDEAKAAYKSMVRSLASQPPPNGPPMPIPPQYLEKHRFNLDDLVALGSLAPHGKDRETISAIGTIISNTIQGGIVPEQILSRLREEANKPDGSAFSPRQVSQLLLGSGMEESAGEFLPSIERATEYKDLEALNLLARHYLSLHASFKKPEDLQQAWNATQAILGFSGDREQKEEALRRAVELAPRVKDEFGQKWLEQSFTDQPERGQEIFATLGTHAATGLQANARNPDARLKTLQLQKTAIDALLKAAPERVKEWQSVLTTLATNWLKEAEFSYQFARTPSATPRANRDMYGNYFFVRDFMDEQSQMMQNRGNMPTPIEAVDVLAARPGEAWLNVIDEAWKPKLAMVSAQLHLKVNEDAQAFPHIEKLAKDYPEKAKELVNEFLRVWTRNHDPNSNRGYTNMYMFMYGFERRADSIPLTRSKQERNLVELAEWVNRLRQLPIGDPDEELLAKAFTNCHSTAEVYKLDAIAKVFGPVEKLKPKTLAGLAQQMRSNLAGLWRSPQNQTDKKTKRKQKEIEQEVLRGYATALAVTDEAIAKFPDEWSLVLAKAALTHDAAGFVHELEKSTEHTARIAEANSLFQKAADMYAAQLKDLPEDQESTRVYELWFYAALGACELGQLNEEKLPDMKQFPLIRTALQALPGEAGDRHRTKFANQLFTRMSSVAPACKYRYLKAGFDIIGDHPAAAEAKKVFDYYKDLVSEIKLETIVDGSAEIGTGKPFGVLVNLKHTREIERESGGFGKYLQNQNSGMYFYYNYGRPLADYRDKFTAIVNEAMKEHFDVMSVTFQTDKVTSKTAREAGWRVTPYAYILLKAKGPQVDKVPPVRLDMDFLDTSGYVILPVESATVPVSAKGPQEPRPASKIKLTQILDERKAPDGKLVVEFKASAVGLVPDLDQLVDLKFGGFTIDKIDDAGVSVAKFDEEGESSGVISERNWMVTLTAANTVANMPKQFAFAAPKVDLAESVFQRYADADLVAATQEVTLGEIYGKPSRAWLWWLGGSVLGACLLGMATLWYFRRPKASQSTDLAIPEKLTPFTLLSLLEKVEQKNGFGPDRQMQLRETIKKVETHYFSTSANGERLDLRRIAEEWVR